MSRIQCYIQCNTFNTTGYTIIITQYGVDNSQRKNRNKYDKSFQKVKDDIDIAMSKWKEQVMNALIHTKNLEEVAKSYSVNKKELL